MGLYPELDALNLDELKREFERDGNEEGYYYYEAVAEHIAAQGQPGLSSLKKIVDEAQIDVPQLCTAIWVLSLQGEDPWYQERLRAFLQDAREHVVAAAVDGLGEIASRDLSENVLLLQTHPSPYVRASVLRYMRKLFPDDAPPLLIAALKDAHPIVREKAIDELDDLGYYPALPDIRPFLYNQPEYVHQAARTAVKNLTVLKKEASSTSPEAGSEGI